MIALLAWSFFMYGTEAMREGLEALRAAGDYPAIRDTVGFLPFLVVVGVTAISGALGIAIHHPAEPLPLASGIALCGGIAVFYLANAIISVRFGRPIGAVLRWAVPALVLTAALGVAAALLPATRRHPVRRRGARDHRRLGRAVGSPSATRRLTPPRRLSARPPRMSRRARQGAVRAGRGT